MTADTKQEPAIRDESSSGIPPMLHICRDSNHNSANCSSTGIARRKKEKEGSGSRQQCSNQENESQSITRRIYVY
jgi:hypothetical protein